MNIWCLRIKRKKRENTNQTLRILFGTGVTGFAYYFVKPGDKSSTSCVFTGQQKYNIFPIYASTLGWLFYNLQSSFFDLNLLI